MTAPLILASGSPRRSQLLAKLSIPFEVGGVEVDEGLLVGDPQELAANLARTKALTAAETHGRSTVLGADTVVVVGDEVLGKPATAAIAREYLERMSGGRVDVITAVAVVRDGAVTGEAVRTELTMNPIGATDITRYLATGAAADKAGGLEVQDRARSFVSEVDGCWANVVGLPLCAVARQLGVAYPRGACAEPQM